MGMCVRECLCVCVRACVCVCVRVCGQVQRQERGRYTSSKYRPVSRLCVLTDLSPVLSPCRRLYLSGNELDCVPLTYQQQSAMTEYLGPSTACCPTNTQRPAGSSTIDMSNCMCNMGYTGPAGGTCTACAPGMCVGMYVCARI